MIVFKGSYLLMYPYVMSLEDQKNHTQTIGMLSVVVHFGAILGAVVGGLVLQVLEPRDMFVVMALGDFLQMAICFRLLRREPPQTKPEHPAQARASSAAAVYRLCLLMVLFYFSGYLVKPFFTVYWEQVAKLDHAALTGLVYAIPGGMALLGLWLNRRSAGRQHALTGSLLLGVCGLLLQAGEHTTLVLLGRCLYGWSMFQVTVRLDALLFELSTPDAYAADFSKINFFQQLGVMGSSFAAGSLVSTFGLTAPFALGAAGFALTALAYPLLVRSAVPATTPVIDKGV
jgi:predicted MFS family arabinose efflux permease